MEAAAPEMRERLIALKLKQDEATWRIADLQGQIASAAPTITPENIQRFARRLYEKLYGGDPDLRQASA